MLNKDLMNEESNDHFFTITNNKLQERKGTLQLSHTRKNSMVDVPLDTLSNDEQNLGGNNVV